MVATGIGEKRHNALRSRHRSVGGLEMFVRIGSGSAGHNRQDEGEAAHLTADFAHWLTEDRKVSLHAEIRRIRRQAADGAMSGALVEWISLAVTSGFSATALVYAHKTFRASLPQHLRASARMVIQHGDVSVVVENGTEEDVARVTQALTALETTRRSIEPPEPPAADSRPSPSAGNAGS
ncbi:hypothetical protein ACFYQT_35495 [Streptomyces tibetensis]|uniref:Uncharacterized protein n=1 Tax=Streptomyces tibetensis TaxID=2382123 RepID=A0ABW6N6D8_9ACTN